MESTIETHRGGSHFGVDDQGWKGFNWEVNTPDKITEQKLNEKIGMNTDFFEKQNKKPLKKNSNQKIGMDFTTR